MSRSSSPSGRPSGFLQEALERSVQMDKKADQGTIYAAEAASWITYQGNTSGFEAYSRNGSFTNQVARASDPPTSISWQGELVTGKDLFKSLKQSVRTASLPSDQSFSMLAKTQVVPLDPRETLRLATALAEKASLALKTHVSVAIGEATRNFALMDSTAQCIGDTQSWQQLEISVFPPNSPPTHPKSVPVIQEAMTIWISEGFDLHEQITQFERLLKVGRRIATNEDTDRDEHTDDDDTDIAADVPNPNTTKSQRAKKCSKGSVLLTPQAVADLIRCTWHGFATGFKTSENDPSSEANSPLHVFCQWLMKQGLKDCPLKARLPRSKIMNSDGSPTKERDPYDFLHATVQTDPLSDRASGDMDALSLFANGDFKYPLPRTLVLPSTLKSDDSMVDNSEKLVFGIRSAIPSSDHSSLLMHPTVCQNTDGSLLFDHNPIRLSTVDVDTLASQLRPGGARVVTDLGEFPYIEVDSILQ